MATEHLTAAPVCTVDVPRAFRWPAAIILWGWCVRATRPSHSHHSAELAMALEGCFRIRRGPSRPWIVCEAALVKADARHQIQIDASTTPLIIALVDPESELGGALFEHVSKDITPIKNATVTLWRWQLGDPVSLDSARVESWFRKLMSRRQAPRLHPGVRKVLQVIREELDDHRRLSLQRMAAIAGLSETRLMHVFTTSVGIPPRPYILWLRFQRAYVEMMMGATLTEAAHRAGFADAAHLSRITKRVSGATTKALIALRSVKQVWFASDLRSLRRQWDRCPQSQPPASSDLPFTCVICDAGCEE
jgi:AraC-like DNA-binding protein